jgi:signal transduction histidine kinase
MQVINQGQVSEDTLAHAFEPWFRGDTSRSQAGSGMGLSIVRQVMELHHGTVQMVQSGDNQVTMVLQW